MQGWKLSLLHLHCPERYDLKLASVSAILSPPNFSKQASASIIREVLPAPGITPLHNIVHPRPLQCAGIEACPHLNALDRWNTHQRQRQPCIETPVPLAVTSQANRHPRSYHLKYPPACLSLRFAMLDIVDHFYFQLMTPAAHGRLLNLLPVSCCKGVSNRTPLSIPTAHRAYRKHMAVYLNTKLV